VTHHRGRGEKEISARPRRGSYTRSYNLERKKSSLRRKYNKGSGEKVYEKRHREKTTTEEEG